MSASKKLVDRVRSESLLSNLLTCVSTVLGLVPAVAVVYLIGRLWRAQLSTPDLWMAAGVLLLVLLVKALVTFVATWQAHRVAYGCLTDLRQEILSHLRRLPLGFFQTRKVGDLATVMKNDVEQVEVYLAHGLPETASAMAVPVAVTIAMLVLDLRLALAMVCGLPIMMFIKKVSAAKWAKGFEIVAKYNTTLQERLTEYVSTIPVIKAFSKSEDKTTKVIEASDDYVTWVTRSMNTISVPMGLIGLCMESGLAAVVAVGAWLLQNGHIGVESLIVAIVLAGAFTSSVAKTATLQHYRVMYNQAMSAISSIVEAPVGQRPTVTKIASYGDLVVDGVSFTYPNKDVESLSDVNLVFPSKTTTALVGASGSGKTTLAHLLMGFWDPTQGRITLGGVDCTQTSQQDWSALFAIVQQDVFMFNLSLEDNIRIGNQAATFDQIVAAAKKARIHDFIESLPKGYATLAGEAGNRFSGGQKQRLSIARAILKDCPIIILDEATSALDCDNEALVREAIDELGKQKTIITIAHHLDTVATADQIVVMDAGRVLATGTHIDLLAHCGQYRKLVSAQHLVDTWDIKQVR